MLFLPKPDHMQALTVLHLTIHIQLLCPSSVQLWIMDCHSYCWAKNAPADIHFWTEAGHITRIMFRLTLHLVTWFTWPLCFCNLHFWTLSEKIMLFFPSVLHQFPSLRFESLTHGFCLNYVKKKRKHLVKDMKYVEILFRHFVFPSLAQSFCDEVERLMAGDERKEARDAVSQSGGWCHCPVSLSLS